jgi:hypothetical protein
MMAVFGSSEKNPVGIIVSYSHSQYAATAYVNLLSLPPSISAVQLLTATLNVPMHFEIMLLK